MTFFSEVKRTDLSWKTLWVKYTNNSLVPIASWSGSMIVAVDVGCPRFKPWMWFYVLGLYNNL